MNNLQLHSSISFRHSRRNRPAPSRSHGSSLQLLHPSSRSQERSSGATILVICATTVRNCSHHAHLHPTTSDPIITILHAGQPFFFSRCHHRNALEITSHDSSHHRQQFTRRTKLDTHSHVHAYAP
ncbi:hypothetical protein DEO72_LG2g3087 [Vigna unguiculata]|uniref:Uncharacterized protein n=1 Tax=Vigna unguiculata TaxID=3917 RepID=A0A4D6L2Q0_VIGUN|nr:hypothetical protein DEO72_LG2g3087 [Vigna unguiculata]